MKALPMLALTAAMTLGVVDAAQADVAGLTTCKDSKAFAKRNKKAVKALEKRMKKYEAGSAHQLALASTIERTNARFAKYGNEGLLCGTDGLPHLIADPGLAMRYGHAGDVFIPTFGFVYFAGLIGHAGREYLKASKGAVTTEYIIDVPKALDILGKSWGWPVATVMELRKGTLLEKEENITLSPR